MKSTTMSSMRVKPCSPRRRLFRAVYIVEHLRSGGTLRGLWPLIAARPGAGFPGRSTHVTLGGVNEQSDLRACGGPKVPASCDDGTKDPRRGEEGARGK